MGARMDPTLSLELRRDSPVPTCCPRNLPPQLLGRICRSFDQGCPSAVSIGFHLRSIPQPASRPGSSSWAAERVQRNVVRRGPFLRWYRSFAPTCILRSLGRAIYCTTPMTCRCYLSKRSSMDLETDSVASHDPTFRRSYSAGST